VNVYDTRVSTDQLDFFYEHGLAYAREMGNRPRTLYGIEASPVGLAAWMIDHDAGSLAVAGDHDPASRAHRFRRDFVRLRKRPGERAQVCSPELFTWLTLACASTITR
jgi:hypothetical protein